jgi:hypothetical protein
MESRQPFNSLTVSATLLANVQRCRSLGGAEPDLKIRKAAAWATS